MSLQQSTPRFSGYIRRLVDEGLVTAQQMQDAVEKAKKNKVSITTYLVESLGIKPLTLAEMISAEFGEPLFDLDAFDPDQLPKDLINSSLLIKHRVIPLVQRGAILYVAITDPTHMEALDAIRFNSTLNVEPVIVEHDKLNKI